MIKIEESKNRDLKEDLDQEELHDFNYTAYITDAINDEYQTIDKYNKALIAFKEGNQDSAVDVIDDIVKEEYTHIGQLQELLKLYSDPSEKIKSGEEEAVGQIEEGEDSDDMLDSFLDKNNLELVKGPYAPIEDVSDFEESCSSNRGRLKESEDSNTEDAEDITYLFDQYDWKFPAVTKEEVGSDISYRKLLRSVHDAEMFNYHSDYWGDADKYQEDTIDVVSNFEPYFGEVCSINYDDGEDIVKVIGVLIDRQYNDMSHLAVLVERL